MDLVWERNSVLYPILRIEVVERQLVLLRGRKLFAGVDALIIPGMNPIFFTLENLPFQGKYFLNSSTSIGALDIR